LDQEHQLAISATSRQISAIQSDFNSGHEPLVKREFGAGDARRPAEAGLVAFAEPLIEGELFKRRIKCAALAGRQGREASAEEQEYETAKHPTFYSTGVAIVRLGNHRLSSTVFAHSSNSMGHWTRFR
jgi:hypothetical protein